MKVFVVVKSPVDLPGAFEFIGAFETRGEADAVTTGAGTYKIAEMEVGRRYRGYLVTVYVRDVLSPHQL